LSDSCESRKTKPAILRTAFRSPATTISRETTATGSTLPTCPQATPTLRHPDPFEPRWASFYKRDLQRKYVVIFPLHSRPDVSSVPPLPNQVRLPALKGSMRSVRPLRRRLVITRKLAVAVRSPSSLFRIPDHRFQLVVFRLTCYCE
jgi:hypothetical protein